MFEIGTILDNKYQIQAHLGTGGMGDVYRVLDLEQGRECALKILNEMMDEQAVCRRFHREFQVLSRFQHPRLVRTYTWGFAEERPYFTMEYLPGKTLEKIIADQALLARFRASYLFTFVQCLIQDKELRERLGKTAKHKVENRFSPTQETKNWLEIYHHVLNK